MGKVRIKYARNENTERIEGMGLHSVCQSAHCPNRSECWSSGTATFMVLGDQCTRACRFCAIKTAAKPPPPDPDEPRRLADAVHSLGLRYCVITSVTRDDLADGGSGHIADCIRALRAKMPDLIIEVLVPDFKADKRVIMTIIDARPDVVSHNIETVERLTPQIRDRRAGYKQSLEALRLYRELSDGIITKSGLMVGFGESDDEVEKTMEDLRSVGADILTIGQYLQPSARNVQVKEYVEESRFKLYEEKAYRSGFRYVASGPLVRSSYRAAEPFIKGTLSRANLI